MVPVLLLLPSNVSEVLLTLCDHWPFMTQLTVAPLLQSSGDHSAGRVLPGHTHTWSDCGYQEILSFWFGWISDFEKKKKKKPHLVILPLLTTILCYPPHCWAPLPSVLPAKDTAFRHTSQLSPTHQWHTHRCSFPGPRVMISPFLLAYN